MSNIEIFEDNIKFCIGFYADGGIAIYKGYGFSGTMEHANILLDIRRNVQPEYDWKIFKWEEM